MTRSGVTPYHSGFSEAEDKRRAAEYVDSRGHLHVPVARSTDPTPARPGWTPYFVNIHLNRPTQKVVTYRRTEAAA